MKTNDLFESFSCKKDEKARRVLNVAPDTQANIDANQLEAGITLEALNDIGVPVFRYQTQITIHGKLPGFDESARIGGYKSIFRNQNGSVGVRYSAIDGEKKALIVRALHAKRGKWHGQMRSDGLTLEASFGYEERQAAIDFAMAAKPLAELVYGSLFGLTMPYGAGFIVCLYVGAIPVENLWPFTEGATGIKDETELSALEAEKERQDNEKRELWRAECEARAAEREAKQAELLKSLEPFRLSVEPKEAGAKFRLLNSFGELVNVELQQIRGRMYYTINGGPRKTYEKGWPKSCAEGRLFAVVN